MVGSVQIPMNIRPMSPGDAPIVYDSWSGSLADELDIKDPDERRKFKRGHKPVIDRILDRSKTFVATSRRDDKIVLGWICVEAPDILHFVFVKKDFRQGLIATRLVMVVGMPKVARASHFTSWGFPRVAKLFDNLTHDPYLGAQ